MSLPRFDREKDLTIKHLIVRLKEEGYASDRKTIWKWEKQEVIPAPRYAMLPNGMKARVYSSIEIEQVIGILKVSPQKKTLIC